MKGTFLLQAPSSRLYTFQPTVSAAQMMRHQRYQKKDRKFPMETLTITFSVAGFISLNSRLARLRTA